MLQLAISLIVFALVQGQPQYEIQLRLPVGFSHRSIYSNQLADGTCCSSDDTSPDCFIACTEIDIYLCFRETTNNVVDNSTACTLGETTLSFPTSVGDDIVFNSSEEATTTVYPGSFEVHFTITAFNKTKFIDNTGMGILNISLDDERELVAVFGSRTLIRVFDFAVSCKDGYYGPDCNISCTPRDDSTGHFTCNEDGTIVCLPGYQNNATNCVEEVPTQPSSTGQPVTTDVTQTSSTGQGEQEPAAVVPMAVGGAVGGGILLLFIILGLVAVIALAWKSRKREVARPEGDAVVFKALTSRLSDESQRSDENLIESISSVTFTPAYTKVNKSPTHQEEAPPIIPYRGDPYTEVARTGLFASNTTATPEQKCLPEVVLANSPAYAEIRHPQVVYTDVALSKVRANSNHAHILNPESEADNTTVQYSKVY